MSDVETSKLAWREGPNAYLERRLAGFLRPARPFSLYLTMRDGCRIAIDVHLPESAPDGPAADQRWPTILFLTPYYRRFAVGDTGGREVERSPGASRFIDLLVPRGYALVTVDVRGTGASFGTRESFRSPEAPNATPHL